jgi:hypothetical protein
LLSSPSAFRRSNSSRLIFIAQILSYDDQPDVACPGLDVGQGIEYSEDVVSVEWQLERGLMTTREHESILRLASERNKTPF